MPWMIRPRPSGVADAPPVCGKCHGRPPAADDGAGACAVCGALLLCADPGPNEVFRLTLVPCGVDLQPLPRRERRSIQVEWGERTQADGTVAKVYRLIDRQNDRYVEKVTYADGTVRERDEPLGEHRGHGSARRGDSTDGRSAGRRWVAL